MTPKSYAQKRTFETTPEPAATFAGDVDPARATPGETFVIQQHYATRLHHDLRLEMLNGDQPVLVSWAVPKGLPWKRGDKHLAVHVEDHPIEYGTFEGTIPKGNYGAGEVRLFDCGTYELLEQEPGKLTFRLNGTRMKGVWHLARTSRDSDKEEWLAFLKADERPERDPLPELTPMLATLVRAPFDDDEWIFEPKWDGVRTIAVCSPSETRLVSRNGRDITATYPELNNLHDRLVCIDGVVDGEVVAFEGGRPSFEKLQSRINLQNEREIERATKTCPVTFIAFDLLYLDGRRMIDLPVEERKDLLEKLVVPSQRIQVSTWLRGDGIALAQVARDRKLEGIVAKRLGCPYRTGKRSRDWLKIKVVHEADVVVGGWSPGEGARSNSFGALLVGAYEGDELRFLGAVGTGFNDKMLDELVPRLHELSTQQCPFSVNPKGMRSQWGGRSLKDPRWVRPELVARVEFRELTSQGKLRAPAFKTLRHDLDPHECRYAELVPE